jgi:hypothetical protein
MPWDAKRAVPWPRLFKEWGLFAALMVLVFALFAKAPAASYIGLAASLPLYLAFGGLLAKFGYSRKTLAELRAERAAAPSSGTSTAGSTAARTRPAPTKRTSTGPQRSSTKKRR